MSSLPVVNSQIQVQRIEVWVTNRTGATTDARDVVGFMDLAESNPYNPTIRPLTNSALPANGNNDLYQSLVNNPSARNPAIINSVLLAKGLRPVEDYEKTFARKLNPNEYYYNLMKYWQLPINILTMARFFRLVNFHRMWLWIQPGVYKKNCI